MTNEEQIKTKIKAECEPSIKQAAVAAAVGAAGGAIISAPNVSAMIVNGARGGIMAASEKMIEQGAAMGECIEKIKKQEEPKKETPPPPVVFTQPPAPQKPVNANANYLVQMQASRNRIMFKGYMRI